MKQTTRKPSNTPKVRAPFRALLYTMPVVHCAACHKSVPRNEQAKHKDVIGVICGECQQAVWDAMDSERNDAAQFARERRSQGHY